MEEKCRSILEVKQVFSVENLFMEDLMKTVEECYDVIVVGAGHAGCEAALQRQDLDARQSFLQLV